MLDSISLEQCTRRFRKETGLVAVWGFGSAFSDHMRSDSDVDFAALWDKDSPEDLVQIGKLILDLESITGRTVDLGKLSTNNLIYAHEAIRLGKCVYARNQSEADAFFARICSLYADFKIDRRVVENAYCAG